MGGAGAFLDVLHGRHATFFPQHFLGRQGMPRRYIDYPEAFAFWNSLSTLGAILSFVSFLFFLGTMVWTLTRGRRFMGANPWGEQPTRWNGRCRRPRPEHTFEVLPSPRTGTAIRIGDGSGAIPSASPARRYAPPAGSHAGYRNDAPYRRDRRPCRPDAGPFRHPRSTLLKDQELFMPVMDVTPRLHPGGHPIDMEPLAQRAVGVHCRIASPSATPSG